MEIGTGCRGAVVCQDKVEHPPTWLASVNAAYLGEYLDRDSAMARVEANIESNMQTVLHYWGLYQAVKEIGRRCGRLLDPPASSYAAFADARHTQASEPGQRARGP
jgi:hypothetical protein